MAVYICDPGLTHYAGHHARWDAQFAEIFLKNGLDTKILCHGRFHDKVLGGAPVFRSFSRTRWHSNDKQNRHKNWQTFVETNEIIRKELKRIFSGQLWREIKEVSPDDIIVFPTILEFQLFGVLQWYYGLEEALRPTMLCYLMAPSGYVRNQADNTWRANSEDTVSFYRYAFDLVEADSKKLHFFACGEEQAAQYSVVRGKPVSSCPLLNSAIQPDVPARKSVHKNILLHVGDPRVEKGVNLLPSIVQALCPKFADWTFRVQLGVSGSKEVEHAKVISSLKQLAQHHDNFELILERLSDEKYCELFNNSEIVVLPYSNKYYFNHSSGILWEAIATANTVVVPVNCWLSSEAERLNASYVAFERPKTVAAETICDAISTAIINEPLPRPERVRVGDAFKSRNGVKNLEKQIFSVWSDG